MAEQQGGTATAQPTAAMRMAAATSGTGATPAHIWVTGRIMPWAEATVHITQVGWPAVGACFEGIRAYWNEQHQQLYVFRLQDHLVRFARSMKMLRMTPELSPEEIAAGLCELLRENQLAEDSYCQPLAYAAGGVWGTRSAAENVPTIYITSRPSPSNLLMGGTSTAGVVSWQRISDNVLPPRIKALPNYANSRLASQEAQRHGFDHPIFLNKNGQVAEGSGSCICIVRDNTVITPPTTASILESITRDSVLQLARDLGLAVQERDVDRTEMYIADEVFFCGTAMEVHGIHNVDGYVIGNGGMGPVVKKLERAFNDAVRGIDTRYQHWLTKV